MKWALNVVHASFIPEHFTPGQSKLLVSDLGIMVDPKLLIWDLGIVFDPNLLVLNLGIMSDLKLSVSQTFSFGSRYNG